MPVNAGYLVLAGAGGVFIWSGLKGKSISSVFRQLAGGDSPTGASSANPVSGVAPPVSGGSGPPVLTSGTMAEAAKMAESYAGVAPYVYGGASPSGWDCSGMVRWIYGQLGVSLPRTSEEQYATVQRITVNQLQPGSLVFTQFPGDNASPGHVGIYVGGDEIVSAEDQALGTGYSTLSSWQGNIVGYGSPVTVTAAGPASNLKQG